MKISYREWAAGFRTIPREIKDRFRCLEGTAEASSFLESPNCFVEHGGDSRLRSLSFDDSPASFVLWSLLLSEEDRLHKSRRAGRKIIGTLKDLGTAPVIAFASPDAVAFYPDGAWWLPCLMEMNEGLLRLAGSLGFGEEACPARATLAAFVNGAHFPRPDLVVAAAGSCCDDFSALMQRVADLGIKLVWWELPYRRDFGEAGEPVERTATGLSVPVRVVDFVERELARVKTAIEETVGARISEPMLKESVRRANRVREVLSEIRDLAYGRLPCPLPALETQICEMIALHFCSDPKAALDVLSFVAETARTRVREGQGVLNPDACRAVWVNPVADLRVMNLFEDLGGAVAGSEYMFRQALIPIPVDRPPLRALALTALADPMIGSAAYRARLVVEEAERYGAEGVVIANIPGASHCATEHAVIAEIVRERLDLPVLEITVEPLADSGYGQLGSRFEAFFDIIKTRRRR
jgi:hypothetical protein